MNEIEELKEGRGRFTEDNVFIEEDIYKLNKDIETIREIGGWKKPWRKAADKIRKKRWGNWDDLILETDGQEQDPQL